MPDQLEETDYLIGPGKSYWKETGLVKPSVLKLHKMVSIPKNLIQIELGKMPDSQQEVITDKLKAIFHIK